MSFITDILNVMPFFRKLDMHMLQIVHGASTAFFFKIIASVFAFTLNILLARILGVEDTGIYYLALTCVTIASIFGRVGLDKTLVRFIAAGAFENDWMSIKGVYNKGMIFALISSSISMIVLILIAPWLSETVFSKPELKSLIRLMSLAVVPLALCTLHSQAFQGLKRIRDSILILGVICPIFLILGVIVLVPYLNIYGAAWSYCIATGITLLLSCLMWRNNCTKNINIKGYFPTHKLLKSCMPLFYTSILNMIIIWFPNIILGIWSNSEDVGIYCIADRTAKLVSFILVAVNSIVAPKFSELCRAGNDKVLGQIARNTTKLMMMVALPILFIFILLPEHIMKIFGSGFSSGSLVLTVLAMGQLVNVISGSVGYLLLMKGDESIMLINTSVCVVINLLLNIFLIPSMGAVGAAISSAITLSVQNLIAVFVVWRKYGIMTIPIPGFRN